MEIIEVKIKAIKCDCGNVLIPNPDYVHLCENYKRTCRCGRVYTMGDLKCLGFRCSKCEKYFQEELNTIEEKNCGVKLPREYCDKCLKSEIRGQKIKIANEKKVLKQMKEKYEEK